MKRLMLSLPEGLLKEIDEKRKTKNYSSQQEVIREIIRDGLKRGDSNANKKN